MKAFSLRSLTRWALERTALAMKDDTRPIDGACGCYACRRFSRTYIRHLFAAGEMLGPILVSLHNVWYYMHLMKRIRDAVREGSFAGFRRDFVARYALAGPGKDGD